MTNADAGKPRIRNLLVSDLDGTLLGSDEALHRFAEWYDANGDGLGLVYASGRFFPSIVEAVTETDLPAPLATIGGVGTDIHFYPSGETFTKWHQRISDRWDARQVREILGEYTELELQPEELQSPYKVSYYLRDATDKQLNEMQQRLESQGLRTTIVYSSNRDLDFLPILADKGKAAAFLARSWGIGTDQVMASGDSGNDRALFDQGFRSIVVANAQPELKAATGSHIYHAKESFADGVLEGLVYWLNQK